MITRGEFVAFILGGLVQRAWPWLLQKIVFWKLERDMRKAVERMRACKHDHVGVEFLGESEDRYGNVFPKCADCWALWIEPVHVTPEGVLKTSGHWTPNTAKPSKRFLLASAVGLGEEAAEAMRRKERGEGEP